MELRRLEVIPQQQRSSFALTLAPVVNYASNMWMHAFRNKAIGLINRVQRERVQAIVGTFPQLRSASRERRLTLPRCNTGSGGEL